MGNCCEYCSQKYLYTQITTNQTHTIRMKSGPIFNGINFTFTNQPLNQIQSQCLIFYADHKQQISADKYLNQIPFEMKVKITCDQRQNSMHSMFPISIPDFNFQYFIIAKIQPWDGHSKKSICNKIYDATTDYLEDLKQKNIKNILITQFDEFSGIHYSLSCSPISKAIKKYGSQLKNVVILCNSIQSMKFYHKFIKQYS